MPSQLHSAELTLVRLPRPALAPAAWFVPGGDPSVWLEELSRWDVPLSKLKLYILPSSVSKPDAAGVLVLASSGSPSPNQDGSHRAEAYGCIAGRLYIPAHARLEPEVTADELEALAVHEINVFHPGIGLAGFSPADGRSVADLLATPPRESNAWDRAQPGSSPYPRLVSVEPDVLISLEDLMQAGRSDIGSKAPQQLPPSKNEINPLAGKVMKAGLEAAAGAAGAIGSIVSGLGSLLAAPLGTLGGLGSTGAAPPSGGRGFLDGFRDWARAMVERLNEQLENARNRELQRLMRMLDEDPEIGLSYAIPLAGKAGAPRGVAPPGASLVRKPVNFNLNSMRGGGPVDYWDMSEKVRAELRAKYIAAANRELSLGRFRRAAYIFSELLGDHNSAANALKQGRHFREAAIIYRDVLKNKGLAAECLEEGGLITEAIQLREQLKQWMHVARLYEKIEQPQEARKAYRKAVDEILTNKDLISAARVLDESMGEVDEALLVLATGWPDSSQARECLPAQLNLLGKLGRHPQALKVIQQLRAAPLQDWQALAAVEVCSKMSATYPDQKVKAKAADMARVLTGAQIASISPDRVRGLATALAAVSPDDRLLARDTSRYVEFRRANDRVAAPPVKVRVTSTRRLIRKIFLGNRHDVWSAASSDGSTFIAATSFQFEKGDMGLLVARCLWSGGEVQRECWAQVPLKLNAPILIDAPRKPSQPVIIGPANGKRVQMRSMAEGKIGLGVHVGTPDWLPLDTVGFCYDERGMAYAVRNEGESGGAPHEASLDVYAVDGKLAAQMPVDHFQSPITPWLPLVVRHERIFLSNGDSSLISLYDGKSGVVDLGRPIRALVASAPFTRLRLGVAQDEGGVVLWPDTPGRKQCRFGQGMMSPVIGFTRGGDLISVTKSEVRIYRTEAETLEIVCSVNGPGEEPFAVLPADGVDEFGIFLKNGEVQVWQA